MASPAISCARGMAGRSVARWVGATPCTPRVCARHFAIGKARAPIRTQAAPRGPPRAKKWYKRTLVRVGVPFLGFMVVGYVGLATFVETKVERADTYVKKQSEREFDMEEQRREMLEKLNLDDFEIKPVPRPVEDDDDELY